MLIIILFFIPGAIGVTEFFFFLYKQKKPLDGPFGFLIDVANILVFPGLYILANQIYGNPLLLLSPPYDKHTNVFIIISIITYFYITYVCSQLTTKTRAIFVMILALTVFLNLYFIFHQEGFLIFFHIPIVLAYGRQTFLEAHKLILN